MVPRSSCPRAIGLGAVASSLLSLISLDEARALSAPQAERFTFASSVQPPGGWTLVDENGSPSTGGSFLVHDPVGGNPASSGYARFYDFAADASFVAAPSAFLGDWSPFESRGSIVFDHQIFTTEGGSVPYIIQIESPSGDEARWYSPGVAEVGGWRRIEANLVEHEWSLIHGSWDSLLGNVSEFRIAIEVVTGQEITGLDNVELFPNVEYASFLKDMQRFDVVAGGRCTNDPEQTCDPDPGAPVTCSEGATCVLQPPQTPIYGFTDCPSCGVSADPANVAMPLVYETLQGQCRFDGVQTSPVSGRDEVAVEVGVNAYRSSGYLCCEWAVACVDCASVGGPPGSFIGKAALFRWGRYAEQPPGPDANLNGRPDDCEDPDADGMPSLVDNCPIANPSQIDSDKDGLGDACDPVCDPHPSNNCVPEPDLSAMLATSVLALGAAARRSRSSATRRASCRCSRA